MDNIIQTIFNLSFYITLLGLVLGFIRLLKGPTISDRVVALDAMTITSISLITFFAFHFRRGIYLDVAFVYGLLSFLGVIAIARYLEGGL